MNRSLLPIALELPVARLVADRWGMAFKDAGVRASRARRSRVETLYWDTPDLRLRQAGVSLALRRAGGRWRQRLVARDGACERVFDDESDGERVDLNIAARSGWRRDASLAGVDRDLAPVFRIDMMCSERTLRFDEGTVATVCVEHAKLSTIASAPARRQWRIARIALVDGSARRAYELAYRLLHALPASRLSFGAQVERGYALITPVVAPPPCVDDSGVVDRADAVRAALDAAAASLAHLCRHVDGASAGIDVEHVHQMRVALRRLRAAALLARGLGVRVLSERVKEEIRWLAQALGDTRDWDVFGGDAWPAMKAQLGASSRPSVAHIEAAIARCRGASQRRLRRALSSRRFDDLVLALAWAIAAGGESAYAPSIHGRRRRVVGRVLAKRARRVVARGADVGHLDARARHSLRVDTKKLRYPAEFVGARYGGRAAKAYVRRLAGIQSALGALNDLAVGRRIVAIVARTLRGEDRGLVRELWRVYAAERERSTDRLLVKSWKRFRDAKPFW